MVIAIDGPNYAGKTSVIKELQTQLEKLGLHLITSKGVSNGIIGKFIDSNIDSVRESAKALLHLIVSDKYLYWETFITSNLNSETTIVFDRYFLSLLAYQKLLGVPISYTYSIAQDLPIPDLEILLVPTEQELLNRRTSRLPTGNIELNYSPQKEIDAFLEVTEFLKDNNRTVKVYQGNYSVKDVTLDLVQLIKSNNAQYASRQQHL